MYRTTHKRAYSDNIEKINSNISTLIPQHYYKYNFLST